MVQSNKKKRGKQNPLTAEIAKIFRKDRKELYGKVPSLRPLRFLTLHISFTTNVLDKVSMKGALRTLRLKSSF
jgi:hypothetical protein